MRRVEYFVTTKDGDITCRLQLYINTSSLLLYTHQENYTYITSPGSLHSATEKYNLTPKASIICVKIRVTGLRFTQILVALYSN